MRFRASAGDGLGLLLRGAPVPARWLDHQSKLDGLCGNLESTDLAIDQGADALDVRLELALGDARRLDADAAQVLGLAATCDLPACPGSSACEMTHSRHSQPSCS